jgi:glycosyltransferase involved in cell wall biosynthesis
MRVVFCIYDFSASNRPLQPWLTIDRVGNWLAKQGHDVHLITDVNKVDDAGGIIMHHVPSLRGNASGEITRLITRIRPDCVVVTVTPLNLVSTKWFGSVPARWIAFASYAFYHPTEIARAIRWVSPRHLLPYARHLLVPEFLWARMLKRRFYAVVCQSARTTARIESACGPHSAVRMVTIPPGVNGDIWNFVAESGRQGVKDAPLLYVGASRAIRGFPVLLQALRIVARDGVRLRVLARGADNTRLEALRVEIADLGLTDVVELVGGWIEPSALADEIRRAAAVVLPFVLVPSELPVSVIESLAVGTPVIATDIDGLPSAVGDAGLIVPAGNPRALAEALRRMCEDVKLHDRLTKQASIIGQSVLSWDDVALQWQGLLDG